jgi:transposase
MKPIKLHDDHWMKIQAFLRNCPNVKVGSARKCRRFVEAVLWMSRSGAQWRLLPAEYGNWNSVYKRFGRWCEAGIWEAMLVHFADDPDMESVLLDSTIVRAHPCAAGAQKKWRAGGTGAGA